MRERAAGAFLQFAFPTVSHIPRSRSIGLAPSLPSAALAFAACLEARRIAEERGGFEDGVARAAASAAYAIVAEVTEAELRGVTSALGRVPLRRSYDGRTCHV